MNGREFCSIIVDVQTDPQNTDYELEAGATRNFEAARTAEKMALQEQKEKEAEEADNPMKVTVSNIACMYCC